jgi:hypothetical protein
VHSAEAASLASSMLQPVLTRDRKYLCFIKTGEQKRLFSSQIAPAGKTGCATREESQKMRHHLVFGPGMGYALSRAVSHSIRLRVLA